MALNKRGGGEVESIRYIITLAIALVILGVYGWLLSLYSENLVSTSAVQAEVVSERIIYDPNGIAYSDDAGRVYPGIIDLSKFNSERLDKSINYTYGSKPAAYLEITRPPRPVMNAYLNEGQYKRIAPLAMGLTGAGSTVMVSKTMPIIAYDGSQFYPATLQMKVVTVKT